MAVAPDSCRVPLWTALVTALERPEWFARAACRGTNPELFFVDRQHTADAVHAKRICATCPVRAECLDYALVSNERFGVWGGCSVDERIALRRQRGLSPLWGDRAGERSA